jgi:F420-0:gamma-glutamyl ligase
MASLVKGGGYRIVEIPVNHRPRRFGQTKYGFGSRGLKTVRDLLGVRWLLDRHLSYKVREE